MSILLDDLTKIDFSDIDSGEQLDQVTPGDVLLHEFMRPLGLSSRALATRLGMPPNRIAGIVNGSRTVTADTALRLAEHFGTTAKFWMNLQVAHDLEVAMAAREKARTQTGV